MSGIQKKSKTNIESLKAISTVVYLLYALSFLAGITAVAGIIIAYIKRYDAKGTWLDSHFKWQIQTFWRALILYIIGFVTMFIIIGIIILIGTTIWYIYRIAKGWVMLSENRAVDD